MAVTTRIPPPPIGSKDESAWNAWYIGIKNAIAQLGTSISWSLMNFTGSNITSIVTRSHQDMQNLQGGTATERYHLTAAQASAITTFDSTKWTDLTDGGTTILHTHVLAGSASLSFGAIASNSTAEQNITVTGAATAKSVMLGPPAAIEAGLIWCGYVSAANTVTVRVHNMSGGSITPATATWHVRVEL